MIDGVLITTLAVIDTIGGNVLHGMKYSEQGYSGFGEAYFSKIEPNKIKAWKRHKEMTLNLIVPNGEIRFVMFDDRDNNYCKFQEVTLSLINYQRLTIPPLVWVGFQGLSKRVSTLLNIANLRHDPLEVDKKDINEIEFDWSL